MKTTYMEPTETLRQGHTHLVCWKSILAGLFVTILCYMVLTALGVGIGGVTASNLIMNEEGGTGLAAGAVIWLAIATVASLFTGSYFAVRAAKYVTSKIGASQGAVIAALFFVLMAWGAAMGVRNLASGLANTALAASSGAANLAMNPIVQDSLQKALGTSTLRSSPGEVAEGLTVRLMRGDTVSAKSYLAYQTGLPAAEIDRRMAVLQTEFEQNAKIIATKTAEAVAAAGWTMFVTMVFGIAGALFGGRLAARVNAELPVAKISFDPLHYNEFVKV